MNCVPALISAATASLVDWASRANTTGRGVTSHHGASNVPDVASRAAVVDVDGHRRTQTGPSVRTNGLRDDARVAQARPR